MYKLKSKFRLKIPQYAQPKIQRHCYCVPFDQKLNGVILIQSGKAKLSMASCFLYLCEKKNNFQGCGVKSMCAQEFEAAKVIKTVQKSQKTAEIPETIPFVCYLGRRV